MVTRNVTGLAGDAGGSSKVVGWTGLDPKFDGEFAGSDVSGQRLIGLGERDSQAISSNSGSRVAREMEGGAGSLSLDWGREAKRQKNRKTTK